ncbi:1041_t:CDS:2 [Entrophospora sp. SA101]|nr:12876_t:CDS:2 [Entrophospora sp. SA101]CAJ0908208.1 1041_t:CDS:2 [Entrophospora sp. SA101]
MTVKLTSLPKNFQLPKSVAILTCNLFAFIFVAGLYLSKKTRIGDRQNHLLTKDHPRVILERVISVVITCFISVIIIWRLILNYEGFSEMEAPFTEEFVFRSCMVTLLALADLSHAKIVFLTPFIFGMAHLHHAWEYYVNHGRTKQAAKIGLFTSIIIAAFILGMLSFGILLFPFTNPKLYGEDSLYWEN